MTKGSLFPKIIKFTIPVMLAGTLQLLYNASDMIVVGRFAEPGSLGAVGATSALINLIVNVFIGLSVGGCVVAARYYGQNNREGVSRTSNTAFMISLISGCFLAVVGFFLARPLLTLMGTPDNVIDKSVLYMKIYFIGIPGNMVYNFGSAIMRGCGDTRRPLIYLSSSGLVNVLLNLLFVIVFKMGVAGVATATIIAQALSAFMVFVYMIRTDAPCRISRSTLKISKKELIMIIKVGLPSGIQGSVFSISNVLIQSSVNSFGSVVMDGNTASGNLEGFIYTAMNSVAQAAMSFVSQNYGAGDFERIKKTVVRCVLLATFAGILMSTVAIGFSAPLLRLYINAEIPNPQVVHYGQLRLMTVASMYFFCGIMDTLSFSVRGIGHSTVSMIVSLLGACLFRIVWIYTVFAADRSLLTLYLSYPISWALTGTAHLNCLTVLYKKEKYRISQYKEKTV
ncbi:MAG: MATE family efflux transporter [Clostridia bacterium]|nr:MATE family efflux transporter [Clostridia bacterium]